MKDIPTLVGNTLNGVKGFVDAKLSAFFGTLITKLISHLPMSSQPDADMPIGSSISFQVQGKPGNFRMWAAQRGNQFAVLRSAACTGTHDIAVTTLGGNYRTALNGVLPASMTQPQTAAAGRAATDLGNVVTEANRLARQQRELNTQQTNAAALRRFQVESQALTNHLTQLKDDLIAAGTSAYSQACFAAGTKLMSPSGPKEIEQFKVGDTIVSRNEFDSTGELEVKTVEEIFRRTAPIWHLHVNGQVIRTTGEHPFFAYNKGWVKASQLAIGDWLLSHDGQWMAVEEVLETGEWEVVYNLRIADYHTYFVTDWDWGFSVWSHNTYTQDYYIAKTSDPTHPGQYTLYRKSDGQRIGNIWGASFAAVSATIQTRSLSEN